MSKQTITDVEIADFCEDGTTVSVYVETENNSEVFHVQTCEGIYRSDLGCWILTNSSNGDISFDDYPNFDFYEIIKEAEECMQSEREETSTKYYKNGYNIHIIKDKGFYQLYVRDPNFINQYTNPYQYEFEYLTDKDDYIVDSFCTKQEALEYLEKNFGE